MGQAVSACDPRARVCSVYRITVELCTVTSHLSHKELGTLSYCIGLWLCVGDGVDCGWCQQSGRLNFCVLVVRAPRYSFAVSAIAVQYSTVY